MSKTANKLPWVGLALLVPVASAHAELKKGEPEQAEKPRVGAARFQIDDADPAAHLPTADEADDAPLLFANMLNELGTRIDGARVSGDWSQAVKYDEAWVRLAPHVAAAYSALCMDAEKLGKRDQALQACAEAIQKNGVTVEDFSRFVHLVVNRPGGIDPIELEDARNAIEHLKADAATRVLALQLQCELSLKAKDDTSFEQCVAELQERAPTDPRSITYAWSLAVKNNDLARAEELIAAAKKKPEMGAAAAMMENSTHQLAPQSKGTLATLTQTPALRWLLGVAVALLAVLFFARRLSRASTST